MNQFYRKWRKRNHCGEIKNSYIFLNIEQTEVMAFKKDKNSISSKIKNVFWGICKRILTPLLVNAAILGILWYIYSVKAIAILIVFWIGFTFSGMLSFFLHNLSRKVCKYRLPEIKWDKINISCIETVNGVFVIILCAMVFVISATTSINPIDPLLKFLFGNQSIYKFLASIPIILLPIAIILTFAFGISIPKKLKLEKVNLEYFFYCIPILNYEAYKSKKAKECSEDLNEKKQKAFKGMIVRSLNHLNLACSLILFIFSIILFPRNIQGSNSSYKFFCIIFFCVILARAFGRSGEIVHAFMKDAFDTQGRSTDITSSERILLAVSSLVEIIFLFAPIYLYLGLMFKSMQLNFGKNVNCLFYSFGITTCTSVNLNFNSFALDFVMALQILTSMTLTVITFARYIGEIKRKSD